MFKWTLLCVTLIAIWRIQSANASNRCEALQPCVQCQMYQTGPLDEVSCAKNCNTFTLIAVTTVKAIEENGDVLCSPMYDEDGCTFSFLYNQHLGGQGVGEDHLIVKAEKERTCRGSIFGWIVALLGGLWRLLVWLWNLLMWLLFLILKILGFLLFGYLCYWLWKKANEEDVNQDNSNTQQRDISRSSNSSSSRQRSQGSNHRQRGRPARSNSNSQDSELEDNEDIEENDFNSRTAKTSSQPSQPSSSADFWNSLASSFNSHTTRIASKAYVTETKYVNGIPVSKSTREVPVDEMNELIKNNPHMRVTYK